MNLHHIVRTAINANHQDEEFKILRSLPSENVNGVRQSRYREITGLKGNFQSESDNALSNSDNATKNTIVRALYLYADDNRQERPWTIYRPLARSGDYVVNSKNEIWKVEAVVEDFSDDGWERLRVALQQTPPNLVIISDNDDE